MRLIDAGALKEYMCSTCPNQERCRDTENVCSTIADIAEQPTVEAEPIKHGHWIRGKNKSAFPAKPSPIWYCSCCGEMIRYNDSTCVYQKKKKKVNEINPRCRRCGARMDGDGDE